MAGTPWSESRAAENIEDEGGGEPTPAGDLGRCRAFQLCIEGNVIDIDGGCGKKSKGSSVLFACILPNFDILFIEGTGFNFDVLK